MQNSKALEKYAIIGLNNQDDFRNVLAPDIAAIVADRSYPNEAQRFLDAMALTVFYESIGTLPAVDEFDELPPMPEQACRQLPPDLFDHLEFITRDQEPSLLWSLCFLLNRYGFVLPDELLIPAIATGVTHVSLRPLVSATLSARGRWLIAMDPQWRQVYASTAAGANNKEISRMDAWEQAAVIETLLQQSDQAALEFVEAQWTEVSVDGRLRLLKMLRRLDSPDTDRFATEALKDKSSHVRRHLMRFLSTRGNADLRGKLATALSQTLHIEKKLLGRKLEILPPETLSNELRALGISDQDYAKLGLAKAALRLGQLLAMAGPKGIAEHLDCSIPDAYALIAQSRFRDELEYFMLEAAFEFQDLLALKSWCKVYRDLQYVTPERLADIMARAVPDFIGPALTTFHQQKHKRLVKDPAVWNALLQPGYYCDETLTSVLGPGVMEVLSRTPLKRPQQQALKLLPLLDTAAAMTFLHQALQALQKKHAPTDILELGQRLLLIKQTLESQ